MCSSLSGNILHVASAGLHLSSSSSCCEYLYWVLRAEASGVCVYKYEHELSLRECVCVPEHIECICSGSHGNRVIPCQINTQNGHPSQILPKLGEHILFPK